MNHSTQHDRPPYPTDDDIVAAAYDAEHPADETATPHDGDFAVDVAGRCNNGSLWLLNPHIVANALTTEADGDAKAERFPLTMRQIRERLDKQTGGWPRAAGGVLFVDDPKHGICWLEKPQELFGWLASSVGAVTWHGGPACVGKAELHAELQRTAQAYSSIEPLPHEPPMPDTYYSCRDVAPGDGKALAEFVSRFAPATPVDQQLMLAAILTPAAGIKSGTRPCFLISSDHGRGVGKTTFAEMVGRLWGGLVSFSKNEDINKIKTRLLSKDAVLKRVTLIDNVKTQRFSDGDIEGLVTANEIGGHRMYVGEATRPNTITWFVTLNGPSLSTDMAQRSVIIKIGKPPRAAGWMEDTAQFVDSNRWAIIADCIALLRSPPTELARVTRWATWEQAVLSRLPRPAEAQAAIAERQAAVDADADEADIIEGYFADRLAELHYDTAADQVFLPSEVVTRWFGEATNERMKTLAVSRTLNQLISEERILRLARNKTNARGRGFVWVGDDADLSEAVQLDINERLSRRNNPNWRS